MENKTTPKIQTKTFTVEKKLECVIREPDFKQLSIALSALITVNGNRDMAGAGKVLLDLCVVSCDKKIKDNPRFLLYLCLEIAGTYLEAVEVEIKKN